MPAYVVRLIQNRDIVGFFAAEDVDDLAIVVDECTDPGACEYAELPVGGIMGASPAMPVPINAGDDEEVKLPELPWKKAKLSESWWSVIYGYTDVTWEPFDPKAPQDRVPDPPKRPMGPARVVPPRPRKGTDRG